MYALDPSTCLEKPPRSPPPAPTENRAVATIQSVLIDIGHSRSPLMCSWAPDGLLWSDGDVSDTGGMPNERRGRRRAVVQRLEAAVRRSLPVSIAWSSTPLKFPPEIGLPLGNERSH
ncbi:hypothetical protein DPEC_G00185650 [Dallia pectoralis]|uniref:Uncharacterized protein n=1 Tax=Dallia pectoralis TaxID=75939 RepID=A0ACC2GBD1_DALPE|nr:hypothetical protein DPEC_G00185650 [Dallia pectoralis]